LELRLNAATIRDWRPEDAPATARHANNRAVWRNLRDLFPHPYTVEHAEEWIRTATAQRPVTHFAIDVDGEAAGGIGLRLGEDVHRKSAEIGFWLGEPFWGRGIASEVVIAITEHGFREFELCRIWAAVFAWNPASTRVLEKAGYRLEGRLAKAVVKDGQTIDQLLYAAAR